MSKTIFPGRHPNFDITMFSVNIQRVLRKLEDVFHLNRNGHISMGKTSEYDYAFLRPTDFAANLLQTDKEVLILFSEYEDYQSRTIDAYDRIFMLHEEHRVDRVVRFLVSDDSQVVEKCKLWIRDNPAAPVIIPFFSQEVRPATKSEEIYARIRSFIYSRDLFSLNSPLRSDLYFFGRGPLINEIVSKLDSSENFGLFGLRRSGKTSILFGVQRALNVRKLRSAIIDCSSPSVHLKRWNELLFDIVESFRSLYADQLTILKADRYSIENASDAFARDLKRISLQNNNGRLILLFDEIERISIGSAASSHWNDDSDFLLFWQSIRSAFQNSTSNFSFLVVGTNPSAIEVRKIQGTDNPIWGNVEKRYIPMFSIEQTKEMVNAIGAVMGLSFPDAVIAKLQEAYGGHPYLTRYACSFIAKGAFLRPIEIDRTLYSLGRDRYNSESDEYIGSMVEFVRETFSQEYDMLKSLAAGDKETFAYYADADPMLVDHLRGYGLIDKGHLGFYFQIGIAERYFARQAKPSYLMTQEEKRTELSQSRNAVEILLRRVIRLVLKFNSNDAKAIGIILAAIPEEKRSGLAAYNVMTILDPEKSPLLFRDLDNIIQKNWALFERVFSPMEKNDFVYHMKTINTTRSDAHASSVTGEQIEKARLSLFDVQKRLEEFLS